MDTALALLLAAASLAVAYKTMRNQNKGKHRRLHYTSTWFRFTLRDESPNGKEVKTYHDDRRVIDPHFVAIRIVNTGQAPITPDDFSGPLDIKFENSRFEIGTLVQDPPNLLNFETDQIHAKDGGLSVTPFLMNPGDTLTLFGLVQGRPENASVSTRIAGIREAIHIEPPNDGMLLKAQMRSMIFELKKDWPTITRINAAAVLAPVTINPMGELPGQVTSLINGHYISNAHELNLIFTNITDLPIQEGNQGEELKFTFESTRVYNFDMSIGEKWASKDLKDRCVTLEKAHISIKLPRLKAQEYVLIRIYLSGDGTDIKLSSQPSWLEDIHMMRFDYSETVETNLANTKNRVLLIDKRLHRTWYSRVKPKFDKVNRLVINVKTQVKKKIANHTRRSG
ncbi:hypothetical protein [Umezawaea tangerina]|uniref:Uncharacterized protein n=1 Tax=Umezawaea tangerina TaxID=84725 RepID=A0A2T0TLP9_9PSEU|nr:hypothetical protein [Umezawaea tangerina]PRY46541.1 hypothetical protein CLV43_101817 [Umezawaea tangerina]